MTIEWKIGTSGCRKNDNRIWKSEHRIFSFVKSKSGLPNTYFCIEEVNNNICKKSKWNLHLYIKLYKSEVSHKYRYLHHINYSQKHLIVNVLKMNLSAIFPLQDVSILVCIKMATLIIPFSFSMYKTFDRQNFKNRCSNSKCIFRWTVSAWRRVPKARHHIMIKKLLFDEEACQT